MTQQKQHKIRLTKGARLWPAYLELIRDGGRLTESAMQLGCTHDIFRRYRRDHPGAEDELADAEAGYADKIRKRVHEVAFGEAGQESDVRVLLKLFESRCHEAKNGPAVSVSVSQQHVIVVPDTPPEAGADDWAAAFNRSDRQPSDN